MDLSSRARRFVLPLLTLLTPVVLCAAEPVDPSDYGLVITHQVVSQDRLQDGRFGLELALALKNDGSHDLYDIRLYLSDADFLHTTQDCSPARMPSLNSGDQDGVTWTYECLLAQALDPDLRKVRVRVEAVDRKTQQIISFHGVSTDGR